MTLMYGSNILNLNSNFQNKFIKENNYWVAEKCKQKMDNKLKKMEMMDLGLILLSQILMKKMKKT